MTFQNEEFRSRLAWAMRDRGFVRNAELARAAGLKEARLISKIFGDPERAVPGHVIAALAQALKVSSDFLLCVGGHATITDETGNSVFRSPGWLVEEALRRANSVVVENSLPTIDVLIGAWRTSGKTLDSVRALQEHCDLYSAPDGGLDSIRCLQLGDKGLAATILGSQNVSDMDDFISRLPDKIRDDTVKKHAAISEHMTYDLSAQSFLMPTPDGQTAAIEYDVLKLPVHGPDGRKLILNFTRLAGPPQVSVNSKVKIG